MKGLQKVRRTMAFFMAVIIAVGCAQVHLKAYTPVRNDSDFATGFLKSYNVVAQRDVIPGGAGYILAYTRKNDDSIKRNGKEHGMYQSAVTDSMHLAYSGDGKVFEPLNYNTGVLFAKNDGDQTKVLKQPYIFRMKDGGFGVLAVRANENEETADSEGKVMFFTSADLLSYNENKMLTLSDSGHVTNPTCAYDKTSDCYYITWIDADTGKGYSCSTKDFESVSGIEEKSIVREDSIDSGIQYAVEGNMVAVTSDEAGKILRKLKPVVNTTVDNAVVGTEPGKPVDLSNVRVTANYSDGSKAVKKVIWNEDERKQVDFGKEGVYEVTGSVCQLADKISDAGNYPFIAARADPNVVKFNGKYYFIATNESGNVNLYIRESDSVAGLNEAKEYLVYDEAKGAEGNIISKSNHWAPELHVIDGELYMFFSTNVGDGWDVQSAIMKLKSGGNPTEYGDWEAPRRYLDKNGKNLNTFYGGITLDMTHFSYNDRHYVVWSQRNFGKNAGTADLWIGETTAENPGQLISEPVMIVACEYSWERNHQNVTEGPNVIITGNKLYLTYSGGATDETYCVGMTQIDLSQDVDFLNADSWRKTNYPLLTGLSSQGDAKYHGPGHNSYVTDEDGDLVNVFHARPGDGNAFARDAFLRRVHFGADGEPVLDMEEQSEILPENKTVKMIVTVQAKKTDVPVVTPPVTDNKDNNTPKDGVENSGNNSKKDHKGEFESAGMKYRISGNNTVELLKPVKNNKTKATIPATVKYAGVTYKVTSIASKAFYNNKKLKQATIGKNVTVIGGKAFSGCTKLSKIIIKSTKLKKAGAGAFKKTGGKAVVKVPSKQVKSYRKLLKGKGLSKKAKIKK
ncbi:MAG: family 43 glycosylhydrolase [Lachnospiraceae bacterium]|nr:family 43 glycosylhydrolase [Lachnospiraceae bacterium]